MIARKSAVSSGASMNEHASKMTHGRVAKYEKKRDEKRHARAFGYHNEVAPYRN